MQSIIVTYFCLRFVCDVIGSKGVLKDHEIEWQGKGNKNSEWKISDKGSYDQWFNTYREENRRNLQKHNLEDDKDVELNNDSNKKYEDNKKQKITFNFIKDRLVYSEEEKDELDKTYGYTGPTANDEPENLIRPCAYDDWQCIRHYFAANSHCTPAYGPIPDPFKLDILTIYFTAVNMTVNLPNNIARGLSSAKVNTFYVNKKTGNLVFAIDVQNLNQTAQRAYFRYRRTAKESIILSDSATVNFRLVTFTAVIPKVPHLRLDLADIHADIQDGYPDFAFCPGAKESTDPDVINAAAQTTVLLPFIVCEGLYFNSQLLTTMFIQSNICDFGLKIASV